MSRFHIMVSVRLPCLGTSQSGPFTMPHPTPQPGDGRLWVDIDSPQEIVVTGLRHILKTEFGATLFMTVGPVDGEPDVVLYDVFSLQDGDTTELDRLRQVTGSVVIAVSYDSLRPDLETLALERGAAAVIPLSIPAEQLTQVIRAAIGGRLDEIPSVRVPGNSTYAGKGNGLTPRESDVLTLIVQGRSNQEIAKECYLTLNSVKTYIRSAYRKMGVTNRAQATVWGIKHGIPAPSDRV